jgi:hypothetical protein
MIEKLLESTARNGWIFFLRILGVALLITGIVTAALGTTLAGLTPVFWALLALGSFLGVICNSLFRIVLNLERKAHD